MSACDTEQAPLHRSVVVLSVEGIGVIGWRLPFILRQPCNTVRSSRYAVVNGKTWLVSSSTVCAFTSLADLGASASAQRLSHSVDDSEQACPAAFS